MLHEARIGDLDHLARAADSSLVLQLNGSWAPGSLGRRRPPGWRLLRGRRSSSAGAALASTMVTCPPCRSPLTRHGAVVGVGVADREVVRQRDIDRLAVRELFGDAELIDREVMLGETGVGHPDHLAGRASNSLVLDAGRILGFLAVARRAAGLGGPIFGGRAAGVIDGRSRFAWNADQVRIHVIRIVAARRQDEPSSCRPTPQAWTFGDPFVSSLCSSRNHRNRAWDLGRGHLRPARVTRIFPESNRCSVVPGNTLG